MVISKSLDNAKVVDIHQVINMVDLIVSSFNSITLSKSSTFLICSKWMIKT